MSDHADSHHQKRQPCDIQLDVAHYGGDVWAAGVVGHQRRLDGGLCVEEPSPGLFGGPSRGGVDQGSEDCCVYFAERQDPAAAGCGGWQPVHVSGVAGPADGGPAQGDHRQRRHGAAHRHPASRRRHGQDTHRLRSQRRLSERE